MSRLLVAQRALTVPGWAKDALWRSARAVPSLDLRFADNKSLTDAVTGASLVTFTRASSGTFVDSSGLVQTAATDVPRFDHSPTTGESLGLLVEEARTNLIVQSENLGTTWTTTGLLAFGSGSTLNATVAPDGATTADLVTENSSASEHRIETAAISWVANTTYTLTIFAKANGRTRMDFFGVGGGNFTGGRNASFNLSTGEVIATDGAVASIDARANGWYRVRITFTTSAAPSASQLFIRFLNNSNNFSYTGDGTSGIYFWGAQLEAGAFPTSYIPTVASTVTRAADVASITGSNFSSWYNQTEGTMFASGDFVALGANSFSRIIGLAGANAGTDEISFHSRVAVGTGDGSIFGAVTVNSSLEGNLDGPSGLPNLSAGYRSAIAYKTNDFGLSSNGLTPTTDTSGTLPTITQLIIMGSLRFQNRLSGHVRRLTYWPTRLGNEVLQRITQ